jgi:eukaryotic-like serine/threonine-protein kinase
MDLWTEFEGHTIDSAFALNKLLQTEGRSAFFSTLNSKGESVLIRLVECHFDEDEILARWQGVQALNHPNFLRIDHYGQFLIEADDITAVYVVFERVDANLGQVLERGRLSPADAAQIGLSMASALETLHAHGFVHEHVEPRNIFAVGETVRLRSDCVRGTPEGERGIEARRRDVFDLALVLTQVLTGRKGPFTSHERPVLPAPFEDIVRNGMSGAWGLEAITAALMSHKATRMTPGAKAVPVAGPKSAPMEEGPRPAPVAASRPAPPAGQVVSAAAAKPREVDAKPFSSRVMQREFPFDRRAAADEKADKDDGHLRWRASFLIEEWRDRFQGSLSRWIAALGMLLAVVLCGWALTHHLLNARAASVAPPPSPSHAADPAPRSARTPSRTASAALRARSSNAAATAGALHGAEQWRVVAFTYNREDQAKKKASSLSAKLPGLQPEAFSPTGKGPWLVTVGGPLDRDAAYALAHRARSLGLPHDTYAQNYKAR